LGETTESYIWRATKPQIGRATDLLDRLARTLPKIRMTYFVV